MLWVRVTRNVVNSPKRTCCERPALDIVRPMIKVAMKQMMEISADVSKAKTIGDFTATRGWVLLICAALSLSACGHKKVQVSIPQPSPISPSDLEGLASYYAEPYHGHPTASGEIFDTYKDLTAAHRTLPFNTMVRVTNTKNGREVDVKINDRGPFVTGRVIDLSVRAAREIDLVRPGVAPVKLKILKQGDVKTAASKPMFGVQVGAFESQRSAEQLKQRLQNKYPSVTVQTFEGEKTMYRVRIGNEPDLQTAEKLASQLKTRNLKPFVVRMD
jgi:rare lipoprotein A